MKKSIFTLAALLLLSGTRLLAQTPLEANPVGPPQTRPLEMTGQAPPEPRYSRAWSRRTARELVQQRAAWKAAHRVQRIEALKWYGYSPQRPPTSPLPFMGSTSSWIGGAIVYYHYPGVFYPRTATMPSVVP